MKFPLLLLLFVVCVGVAQGDETGEQHTNIIFGGLFPKILHSDRPLSFIQIGEDTFPTKLLPEDAYRQGVAAGREQARADYEREREEYHEAKRRVLERAAVAESQSAAAATQTDNTTCKFPRTHIHFYMPHTGPVNPMVMMPFMHPGGTAMWGGGFGAWLDVTSKSETTSTATAATSAGAGAATEAVSQARLNEEAKEAAALAPEWRSSGWASLDFVHINPESIQAHADQAEVEETNGGSATPEDPCLKVPQMHLHIYDPTTGHKAAVAATVPAAVPYSPYVYPQYAASPYYNPYGVGVYTGMHAPPPPHPLHGF